jgi:anhydro-N-acetylmuramic acid kinase
MPGLDASGQLFLGIMSGTSADGVDAVALDLSATVPKLCGRHYQPFAPELRARILALQAASANELHEAALVSNELSRLYASSALSALKDARRQASEVRAIGCHGQTVRHRPDLGYTLQLVNGALLAELTGITVVCDFRSRDIAAGGQGAPLVPAFHAAMFSSPRTHRVIVNIGGIANLTDLPGNDAVRGFDTGPGNVLLDAWSEKHLGLPHDEDGRWARAGRVLPDLLRRLLAHGYFAHTPPKSTGRDEFNLRWLESHLSGGEKPQDVQATLLELTAATIAAAVTEHCRGATEIYACGGGVHNSALMESLRRAMPGVVVDTTEMLGIAPDWVEACAFAWLARRALEGAPGNLPSVTGARGPRVLGAIHRA